MLELMTDLNLDFKSISKTYGLDIHVEDDQVKVDYESELEPPNE